MRGVVSWADVAQERIPARVRHNMRSVLIKDRAVYTIHDGIGTGKNRIVSVAGQVLEHGGAALLDGLVQFPVGDEGVFRGGLDRVGDDALVVHEFNRGKGPVPDARLAQDTV